MSSAAEKPVRTIAMLQRRPGMTFEEFERYWVDVHAPYIQRIPGIVSYTQRHVVQNGDPNPMGVDGFVILEYASAEAREQARVSDAQRAASADADNFRVNIGRTVFEDLVIFDRSTNASS